MSTEPALASHYRGAFEGAAMDGPGWLNATRRNALARFEELGFPGPHDEAWKYTNVRAIEKRRFAIGAPRGALDRSAVSGFEIAGLNAYRVVLSDACVLADLSELPRGVNGVRVQSLVDAVRERPQFVEAHLARGADAGANGFAALNAAFLSDGVIVELADGVTLDRPLHVLHAASGADDVAVFPRVLIVAGGDSAAEIVESYVSIGPGAQLTDATTEIVLSEGARLEHYRIQNEGAGAYHVGALHARLAARSRFVSHAVSVGARLARHDIEVVFQGEHAHAGLNGLYLATERQHVDFHTRIEHAPPNCTSDEYYKGILDGHGRGVFSGYVHVHPDAQKTDARQANLNLVLSRDAEIDTKPQLEIYADDVKCSHGATVGQLDEQQLFYLRARGIDRDAARELLTWGFAGDVLSRMPLEAVRSHVESFLVRRLPGARALRELI
ncbi:MAG: Fe-S cluster assembly protein SufD [Chromatiales bacterium]|nr:Fe-S cluster assembly protein SufD [Chromatiales bacterium]